MDLRIIASCTRVKLLNSLNSEFPDSAKNELSVFRQHLFRTNLKTDNHFSIT